MTIPPINTTHGKPVGMTTERIIKLLEATAQSKPRGVSATVLKRIKGGTK